jgi:hypothetical protein
MVALVAFGVLLPGAQACSLAYQPFADPSWDAAGDLRYVDGSHLLRVEGAADRAVADGFFLSYADADGGLLVSGQDGLGGDCSGTRWLRWLADGSVAWERTGVDRGARVVAHADGPLVALDGRWWRWRDGDLHATDWTLPEEGYLLGATADGAPVTADGQRIVAGDHVVDLRPGEVPAVAHNASATAFALSGPDGARLVVLAADGRTEETRWAARQDVVDVAWADATGWVVAAGGRAFLVAGGLVTDLGVDALAVGARGPQPAAFGPSGYTVFAGPRAVEQWTRAPDGTWSAGAPHATAATVPATATGSVAGTTTPASPHGRPVPAPPAAWSPAVLAAAAFVRALTETRHIGPGDASRRGRLPGPADAPGPGVDAGPHGPRRRRRPGAPAPPLRAVFQEAGSRTL